MRIIKLINCLERPIGAYMMCHIAGYFKATQWNDTLPAARKRADGEGIINAREEEEEEAQRGGRMAGFDASNAEEEVAYRVGRKRLALELTGRCGDAGAGRLSYGRHGGRG